MLCVVFKQRGVYEVRSIKREFVNVRYVDVVKESDFCVFAVFVVEFAENFGWNTYLTVLCLFFRRGFR